MHIEYRMNLDEYRSYRFYSTCFSVAHPIFQRCQKHCQSWLIYCMSPHDTSWGFMILCMNAKHVLGVRAIIVMESSDGSTIEYSSHRQFPWLPPFQAVQSVSGDWAGLGHSALHACTILCGDVPFVSFCSFGMGAGCPVWSVHCIRFAPPTLMLRLCFSSCDNVAEFAFRMWACFIMFSGLCSARTSGLLHLERSLTNRHGRWCSRRHFFSLSPGSLFPANFCNSLLGELNWHTQSIKVLHHASPWTDNWRPGRPVPHELYVHAHDIPSRAFGVWSILYQIDLLFSSSRGSYGARGETTEPRVAWQIWCFGSVIIRLYV